VSIKHQNLEINSMTPPQAAMVYMRRRWCVVPVPYKTKKPVITGWPDLRISSKEIPKYFNGTPINLGVILGDASDGMVDADLDCIQAIRLAEEFLPPTACTFGRAGKPHSHLIYVAKPSPATRQFHDVRDEMIDGTKKHPMLVELRSTGAQTVFPPSIHESGEPIVFDQNGEPSAVEPEQLLRCMKKLAAASLLAKYWPGQGIRHHTAGALAGGLARAGWARSDVIHFVGAVARVGGDDEVADRERVAGDSVDGHRGGDKITGWRRLAELIGADIVGKVREWLDVQSEPLEGQDSVDADEGRPSIPLPQSLGDLVKTFPSLRPPVIHGLLRQGETMNVIAPPKTGKSWLVLDLAISLATGQPWFGCSTVGGTVLIIDNELHPETITHRIPKVAAARGVSMDQLHNSLHVASLRGNLRDIFHMRHYFEALEPGRYPVIILDAFYRFLPQGADENNNATMANIYNELDRHAQRLRSSFVLIHHSTKGNQAAKSVTDVGAGAGSQARATDCHLVLRPHQEKWVVVMDAVVRSFPPFEPFCLRWNFPVWVMDKDLDPNQLKKETGKERAKRGSAGAKSKPTRLDWTMDTFVQSFVTKEPKTELAICGKAREKNISGRRAKQLLQEAIEDQKVFAWEVARNQKVRYATQKPTGAGLEALRAKGDQ